jgi:hypothetical protein
MLDLSHIPNSQQDVKIFYSNGVTNAWQTWQKPRKCNYVWIMCIGGAGSGASGGTANLTTGTYGGAGAVTRILYNAQQLPDRLYVQVGLGGAESSATGNPGTRSLVALQPVINVAQNLVTISGAVAASTGLAETAATQTTMTFATLGNFISTPGFGPGNVDVNPLTSTIVTQGASGGGKDTATNTVYPAKEILSSSISPLISGGISSTTTNGTNGSDGITSWKPFFSLGGAGGGGSLVGVGGKGGAGGIGSGGGGGGAGQTAGGAGGKGGDGLVVIISF